MFILAILENNNKVTNSILLFVFIVIADGASHETLLSTRGKLPNDTKGMFKAQSPPRCGFSAKIAEFKV